MTACRPEGSQPWAIFSNPYHSCLAISHSIRCSSPCGSMMLANTFHPLPHDDPVASMEYRTGVSAAPLRLHRVAMLRRAVRAVCEAIGCCQLRKNLVDPPRRLRIKTRGGLAWHGHDLLLLERPTDATRGQEPRGELGAGGHGFPLYLTTAAGHFPARFTSQYPHARSDGV